ncbi:MAG: methylated-DNA--[protein]-cysteine S-methyltransferase [Gammaproteobacteria bacterium]|jgi:methylated-DNA-[protein]-cysteine S-methyltransferase
MSGTRLSIDELDTPVGTLRLQFDSDGLHAVTIVAGRRNEVHSAAGRSARYPYADAFKRYFAGDIDALTTLPIVLRGTDFQQRVWGALRRIPPGTTQSYAELAAGIGNRKAVRAVGSANGRNPLCVVVPCHRVIGADGSLGGFSAGLEVKRWLLQHEGAAFKA